MKGNFQLNKNVNLALCGVEMIETLSKQPRKFGLLPAASDSTNSIFTEQFLKLSFPWFFNLAVKSRNWNLNWNSNSVAVVLKPTSRATRFVVS